MQESGPENLAAKNALYLEIDRCARPKAIIGSSTIASRPVNSLNVRFSSDGSPWNTLW